MKLIAVLLAYYSASMFSALLDGVGMVMLVDLVAGKEGFSSQTAVLNIIGGILRFFSISPDFNAFYFIIIFLFSLRVGLVFLVNTIDGYLEANLRRRLQEYGYSSVMRGNWEFLRDIRVGERVGAITEEATYVTKYLMSIMRALGGFFSSAVLMVMAMLVSAQLTVMFVIIGIPALLIMKHMFNLQAKLIEQLVAERQGFYASITERLNGLFQIIVGGEVNFHISHGINRQIELTKLEMNYYIIRALLVALNMVLPAVALLIFYAWSIWKGHSVSEAIYLLAGVGIVGARAMSQVNIMISSIGSITGFSGSILPVYKLFTIPKDLEKKEISEKIKGVKLSNVNYLYGEGHGISSLNLSAEINTPLVIMGSSGSGKTTLANLIVGIYRPTAGEVLYLGVSGKCYDADEFRSRIGYVTQDIQLFHGTVRDNLNSFGLVRDDIELWTCLRKAGAEQFVKQLGGLDAVIAESGRSLSGGEKRRLGIARVLAKNPDILILDEVTVGLDEVKKNDLIGTIKALTGSLVVVIITHETIDWDTDNVMVLKERDVLENIPACVCFHKNGS